MYKPKIINMGKEKIIICPTGNIFIDSKTKVKELNGWIANGRIRVHLLGKDLYLHALIAKAFLENPNNYKYVGHKNKNTLDNNVNNLFWVKSIRKFNADYYDNIDMSNFTESDFAIYNYYHFDDESTLYNLIFLNKDFNWQINKFIRIGFGAFNETILEDTYKLLLERIKTTSIVPTGRTTQGFICYVRTMAYYIASFNRPKRYNDNLRLNIFEDYYEE